MQNHEGVTYLLYGQYLPACKEPQLFDRGLKHTHWIYHLSTSVPH